jgi:flagellar biosynthetic protein FliR
VITLTTGQLEAWVALYLWPFVRIAGCLMVAPVFGAGFVPARARLVLAGAVTLLVAPLLPMPEAGPFSGQGVVIIAQQLLVGVGMGFALQLVFDAMALGGQLLANSMGLSFAFNVDPQRGASTPVLGQFYLVLVTLVFLALDGHLALLETLVDSFRSIPIGTTGLGREGLWALVLWGSRLFQGALAVSLPGVTALLVVNLAFGVVSRAAPSLNLFAVGFPVTLVCGLLVVMAGLPAVGDSFTVLLRETFAFLQRLAGGP